MVIHWDGYLLFFLAHFILEVSRPCPSVDFRD
jgi:hypothetical protein